MASGASASLALAPVLLLLVLLVAAAASPAAAKYVNGIGFNLNRPPIALPQQPHQVSYPLAEDTSRIARRNRVTEAAVVCDAIAPVGRVVQCDIHTFDECGSPFGDASNVTTGWDIDVQEVLYPGSSNSLVSPITWVQMSKGRFYFTPLRQGPHRVVLTRNATPLQSQLTFQGNLGERFVGAGFLVWVRDTLIKSLSAPLGQTTAATRRLLWAASQRNAEPRNYPPATPATRTYQDTQVQFADPVYARLQQAGRRPVVQPFAVPSMPVVPAADDHNNFRLADVVPV
jgi:hypothetical protein